MKIITLILISLSFLSIAHSAPSAETNKNKKTKNTKELSFDEILVQGKHHFSDEAIVTVEQDKVLDALLEVRKDFKDRIQQSAKRN